MQIYSPHSCPTSFPCVVIYFLSLHLFPCLLRQGDNNEAPTPSLGIQRDFHQDSSLVLHYPAGGAGVGARLQGGQCRTSKEANPLGLSLLFPLVNEWTWESCWFFCAFSFHLCEVGIIIRLPHKIIIKIKYHHLCITLNPVLGTR